MVFKSYLPRSEKNETWLGKIYFWALEQSLIESVLCEIKDQIVRRATSAIEMRSAPVDYLWVLQIRYHVSKSIKIIVLWILQNYSILIDTIGRAEYQHGYLFMVLQRNSRRTQRSECGLILDL